MHEARHRPLMEGLVSEREAFVNLFGTQDQREGVQAFLEKRSYPKPILCWGHGIVMGGGLGLFAGSSHRWCSDLDTHLF
jgi:enoyl-CoA hydratase/carnithine racemase